jgi:hypothetical protein
MTTKLRIARAYGRYLVTAVAAVAFGANLN